MNAMGGMEKNGRSNGVEKHLDNDFVLYTVCSVLYVALG
jgi:hypothetical protein